MDSKKTESENTIAVGVGIGLVAGVVMMSLTGDAVWIGVGIALGAGIGLTWRKIDKTGDSKDAEEN